jgi:hypothetical protein
VTLAFHLGVPAAPQFIDRELAGLPFRKGNHPGVGPQQNAKANVLDIQPVVP